LQLQKAACSGCFSSGFGGEVVNDKEENLSLFGSVPFDKEENLSLFGSVPFDKRLREVYL
jgi:hypothetical protein